MLTSLNHEDLGVRVLGEPCGHDAAGGATSAGRLLEPAQKALAMSITPEHVGPKDNLPTDNEVIRIKGSHSKGFCIMSMTDQDEGVVRWF